jgi:curved DNA-binding protein CbpA
MKDYYAILGVARNATQKEISDEFKRLALTFHPDRFTNLERKNWAQRKMIEINEAYEVLGNPERRRDYDRELAASAPKESVSQQSTSDDKQNEREARYHTRDDDAPKYETVRTGSRKLNKKILFAVPLFIVAGILFAIGIVDVLEGENEQEDGKPLEGTPKAPLITMNDTKPSEPPVEQTPSVSISNSIADGSFESGQLPVEQSEMYGRWWSTGSRYGGKVTITNEDKQEGEYSLKISSGSLNDLSKAGYVYQFFNFSNDTYSFSFWYKGEGKAVAEVLTGWSPTGLGNEEAKAAAYVVLGDEGFPADGQWHHVKIVQSALGQSWYLDGKTPSCHPYTRVVPDIVILGDVSGLDYGGTFYFDEISLEPYNIQELEC